MGRGGLGLHREASARLLVGICVAWNGELLKGRRYFVRFICSSLLVRWGFPVCSVGGWALLGRRGLCSVGG